MTQVYVPWPQRRPKEFKGPAKAVANLAIGTYRAFGPVVRRIPGILFSAGLIGGVVFTWLVALLFISVGKVQAHVQWHGPAQPGTWLSIEQIGQVLADPSLHVPFPAWLIWGCQSLLLRDIVAVAGVLGFVSVLAMFAIWWERKVAGFIQSRVGPMRVGGWHGWSQSLADGIKLICKEDLIPDRADRPLFRLAPYLSFVPALGAFVALPFSVYWVFRDLDVALLMVLAMMGLEVVGVLIAGWASNNKWSLYGAMREACQVVSYEIPLGLSLLVPIMVVGSLRLSAIAEAQAGGWFNWLAWHSPWTFIAAGVFFVASLASCKRAPFDLPEAESELVAGFHTEYSGFRWAVFFFAEYASMFVVSALLVILFLGAWDAPWALPAARPGDPLYDWANSPSPMAQAAYGVLVSGPLWFILKCIGLLYVQMWLRWTLPRLRIDQVLYACIQVIVPLMLVVLAVNALWELALPQDAVTGGIERPGAALLAGVIRVILGLVGMAAAVAVLLVALAGHRRRRTLVGDLGVERLLPGG